MRASGRRTRRLEGRPRRGPVRASRRAPRSTGEVRIDAPPRRERARVRFGTAVDHAADLATRSVSRPHRDAQHRAEPRGTGPSTRPITPVHAPLAQAAGSPPRSAPGSARALLAQTAGSARALRRTARPTKGHARSNMPLQTCPCEHACGSMPARACPREPVPGALTANRSPVGELRRATRSASSPTRAVLRGRGPTQLRSAVSADRPRSGSRSRACAPPRRTAGAAPGRCARARNY